MKTMLRNLLFVVMILPLLALQSCKDPNSDDEISAPLSSTYPSWPDRMPDGYLETHSWKRLSDTQFQTIWNAYDLTTKAYDKANVYQKDKQMGDIKQFWECPIERSGSGFVLSFGMGYSVNLYLTQPLRDYDAVYQAKDDSNLIRFYDRDENGNVYESVHKNGWLVQVNEVRDSTAYNEIIYYW